MFSREWDHWVSTLAPAQAAALKPSERNTVMRLDDDAAKALRVPPRGSPAAAASMRLHAAAAAADGSSSDSSWSLADHVLSVDAGAAAALLKRYEGQQVIYIGHPVLVWPPTLNSKRVALPPPANAVAPEHQAAYKQYHLMAMDCPALRMDYANWYDMHHSPGGPSKDLAEQRERSAASRARRGVLLAGQGARLGLAAASAGAPTGISSSSAGLGAPAKLPRRKRRWRPMQSQRT